MQMEQKSRKKTPKIKEVLKSINASNHPSCESIAKKVLKHYQEPGYNFTTSESFKQWFVPLFAMRYYSKYQKPKHFLNLLIKVEARCHKFMMTMIERYPFAISGMMPVTQRKSSSNEKHKHMEGIWKSERIRNMVWNLLLEQQIFKVTVSPVAGLNATFYSSGKIAFKGLGNKAPADKDYGRKKVYNEFLIDMPKKNPKLYKEVIVPKFKEKIEANHKRCTPKSPTAIENKKLKQYVCEVYGNMYAFKSVDQTESLHFILSIKDKNPYMDEIFYFATDKTFLRYLGKPPLRECIAIRPIRYVGINGAYDITIKPSMDTTGPTCLSWKEFRNLTYLLVKVIQQNEDKPNFQRVVFVPYQDSDRILSPIDTGLHRYDHDVSELTKWTESQWQVAGGFIPIAADSWW